VWDGPTKNSPRLARLCGYDLPNPIFSTGNSLLLVSSDTEGTGGMDITYTTTDRGISYGNKSTCCGLGNVVHPVLRTTVMSFTLTYA